MSSYFLRNRIIALFISLFLFSIFPGISLAVTIINCHEKYTDDLLTDSLPYIFNENHGDLVESNLRHEAVYRFPQYQLPRNKQEWGIYKFQLKNKIIEKTGVLTNQNLPLNLKETGSLQMTGYSIKNIAFQTRPGIYATANLYIPDGKGKFQKGGSR